MADFPCGTRPEVATIGADQKKTAALCLKFPKVPTFIKPKVSRTVTEKLSFIYCIFACPIEFINPNLSCLSARNLIFNLVPRNFRALLLHKLDRLLRTLYFLVFFSGRSLKARIESRKNYAPRSLSRRHPLVLSRSLFLSLTLKNREAENSLPG